ncbi:MAG: hypothetical protein CMG21_03545 [Candidatus Marinimicrobia bacterium]|nr:hypothetical protein [Candidatus Neomarinimicrobiota bacterium]
MKKILLIITTFSLALTTELLQEGVYPECSYVVVTADGWRIHKNYQGRVLSMKAPNLHDTKMGKYSFDKFGNLTPYTDCETIEMSNEKETTKKDVEVDIKFDFSKLTKINPTFSVSGGASMPYGDNLNYEVGYHYGLDVNPNFSGIFKNISFSFMGMNLGHTDGESSSLTSTGLFTNYTLNWKKIGLTGGVGMISQEGVLNQGQDSNGSDMGMKGEISFNLSNKMSVYTQGIMTTTFLGEEQTATYLNFGLKYNF